MADEKEEEKRSGAVLPFGGGGAAGSGGWGGWLNAAARAMAVSPEAALLRILSGAVLGVGALGLTATLYGRASAGRTAPLAVDFEGRRPGEASPDKRRPMEDFVRGMAGLWGPVLGLSDAPADDADALPAPDADAGAAAAKAAEDAEAKGREDPKEPGPEDGAAGPQDAAVGGGDSGAGAGSGGGALGSGALASADLAGAARAGAAGGPALGDDAGTAAPAKREMRAGAVRSARPMGGKAGKGALNQLKFAQGRSALGAATSGAERSYGAAQSAFEGGGPAGAGSGIGGAGAGQGGAGLDAGSANPRRVDVGRALEDQKRLSCPSGYTLDGADCKPLEVVNKTPYQSLVDMAKAFLVVGAALALLGLVLVTRPVPWMQALGGILLGAAAGLIIAALAIGADIQSRYGQKGQKDAIDASAGRAGKGQSP